MFVLLVDSHCHVDWFKNPEKIVKNALNKGVNVLLSNATSIESISKTLALAKQFSQIKPVIGVHPVDLLKFSDDELDSAFELVEKNISKAIAVGEVGLDYKYAKTQEQKDKQERVFRRFIALAIKYNKPIVVHARYAESKAIDILEEMKCTKVLMHWFTNSKKTSSRALKLGFFVSCGPIILSDTQSAEIASFFPLTQVLLETDSPVEFVGKKSEPSWIPFVCAKFAELKGVSQEEVEQITEKNYKKLFC